MFDDLATPGFHRKVDGALRTSSLADIVRHSVIASRALYPTSTKFRRAVYDIHLHSVVHMIRSFHRRLSADRASADFRLSAERASADFRLSVDRASDRAPTNFRLSADRASA